MVEVEVEVVHLQLVDPADLVVAVDMLITEVELRLLDLVVMLVELV